MQSLSSSHGIGIRGRLALLTGAMALSIALIGGSALVAMGRLHAASQSLATEWMPRIALSTDVTSALASLRSAQYAHIMAFSREEKTIQENAMDGLMARMDGLHQQMSADATTDGERATLASFERDWRGYKAKHQEIITLSREGENETAAQLMMADQRAAAANSVGTRAVDAATLFRQLTEEVTALAKLHREGGEQARLDAQTTYDRMLRGLVIALVVTIGLSVGVAVWIARGISRPVISAMRVLRRVAEGDLTAMSDTAASGELRQLLASLDETRQGLTCRTARSASRPACTPPLPRSRSCPKRCARTPRPRMPRPNWPRAPAGRLRWVARKWAASS
jgi:nitrogen fixation/metabolism regulation signal transduction histidine kinase